MSVEIGTATDFEDLYNKLITFITTGVGVGENWSIVAGYEQVDQTDQSLYTTGSPIFTEEDTEANRVIVQGVGTGTGGEVYVGLYTYKNVFTETYTIGLAPLAGFDSNFDFFAQPTMGLQPQPKMLCWDSQMPYWFIANGRRFMAVVRVNSTYQFLYGGFFLPYALTNEYTYPYCVGAMSSSHVPHSQSDNDNDVFLKSANHEHGQICYPDGTWHYLSGGFHNSNSASLAPFNVAGLGSSSQDNYWDFYRPDFGGIYHLIKLEPVCASYTTGLGVFGCLDGVHVVSGHENSAENTMDIDGIQHLVFTNAFRVSNGNYFTARLL